MFLVEALPEPMAWDSWKHGDALERVSSEVSVFNKRCKAVIYWVCT